jgi:hypothetical protein
MKTVLNILSIVLLLAGATFFLGSFMAGDLRWAVHGVGMIVISLGFLFRARRL